MELYSLRQKPTEGSNLIRFHKQIELLTLHPFSFDKTFDPQDLGSPTRSFPPESPHSVVFSKFPSPHQEDIRIIQWDHHGNETIMWLIPTWALWYKVEIVPA